MSATLKNVAYAKDAEYNLFSLTYMMMKGWTMLGDKEKIILKKGDTELKLTHKVKTDKGFLFVIKFVRTIPMEQVFIGVASKPIAIDKGHRLLTHSGEADTRATCKHLDIPLQ